MNDNEKKRLEELEIIEKKYKTRNQYINNWQKDRYYRLTVLIPKEQKDAITETAKTKGFKTVSDYIKALIEYDMNASKTTAAAMPETILERTPKNSYNPALYEFDDDPDYIPPKKPIEYDYTLEEQLNRIKEEHNL